MGDEHVLRERAIRAEDALDLATENFTQNLKHVESATGALARALAMALGATREQADECLAGPLGHQLLPHDPDKILIDMRAALDPILERDK